jgi:hypothetical protein
VFCVWISAVGAAAADTPPASDNDNPAAPQGWGKFALRSLLSVRHVQSPSLHDFRREDVLRLMSHHRDIIADNA